MNRFEWLKAVQRANLTARAKVIAGALAVQFANDETGQINPSVATLAEAIATSCDTVKRGIADLAEAGWLAKVAGRGRGNKSNYVLLSPGQVVALRPVVASKVAPKRGQDCTVSPSAKGCTAAAKRGQDCTSHIRKEQSFEQKARASEPRQRPLPHLHVKVEGGGWQAEAWGKWLWAQRLPSLDELPVLAWDTGYDLPWSQPPTEGDDTGTRMAKAFFDWAMNHESKGRKHVRAS